MELNNTPINFKGITNSTAIAVKIKPVPCCLAELGPKANWIFSRIFEILLEELPESSPAEERRGQRLGLGPRCPNVRQGLWAGRRRRPVGFQPKGKKENKCPQHSSESGGWGQWELGGFVHSAGGIKSTEGSSECWN